MVLLVGRLVRGLLLTVSLDFRRLLNVIADFRAVLLDLRRLLSVTVGFRSFSIAAFLRLTLGHLTAPDASRLRHVEDGAVVAAHLLERVATDALEEVLAAAVLHEEAVFFLNSLKSGAYRDIGRNQAKRGFLWGLETRLTESRPGVCRCAIACLSLNHPCASAA